MWARHPGTAPLGEGPREAPYGAWGALIGLKGPFAAPAAFLFPPAAVSFIAAAAATDQQQQQQRELVLLHLLEPVAAAGCCAAPGGPWGPSGAPWGNITPDMLPHEGTVSQILNPNL